VVAAFDLSGVLRRIRRQADVSQRELARACAVSQSTVARAETGRRDLPVSALVTAAGLAHLRLTLVDEEGQELSPMSSTAVRDEARRRFPAHLDTRYGDEDWWHGPSRYDREQPWFTFDRLRWTRDTWRERTGTPEDHHEPRPGDSPEERKARRNLAALLEMQEEYRRRREAGLLPAIEEFVCSCPEACEELDDRSGKPVHTQGCPCLCDVA
jgi:transcriptional regulator with XRE-family HTH domain